MGVTIATYIDVRQRAVELDLGPVTDFAILPRGFEAGSPDGALADEADATTIRKLLNEAGLSVQQLRRSDRALPSVVQRSADWIAPTLFVGSMFLSQNPHAIQLALGVMDSYISDFLKGRSSRGTVKLTIVVEKTKSREYRRVDYEGPPSGVKNLADVVRSVHDEPS
jgi:hypothetical protein